MCSSGICKIGESRKILRILALMNTKTISSVGKVEANEIGQVAQMCHLKHTHDMSLENSNANGIISNDDDIVHRIVEW